MVVRIIAFQRFLHLKPWNLWICYLTRKQRLWGNLLYQQYDTDTVYAVHGVAEGRTWLSDFTFTFHFHALEKEMATHSSDLAWRIPGKGEPGGLPSMGLHRVGHDWSDLAAAAAAARYFTEEMGKRKKQCINPISRYLSQYFHSWYFPLLIFPKFSVISSLSYDQWGMRKKTKIL